MEWNKLLFESIEHGNVELMGQCLTQGAAVNELWMIGIR
jgi:hypothetical protein